MGAVIRHVVEGFRHFVGDRFEQCAEGAFDRFAEEVAEGAASEPHRVGGGFAEPTSATFGAFTACAENDPFTICSLVKHARIRYHQTKGATADCFLRM